MKSLALIVSAFMSGCSLAAVVPTKIDHGWKTDRVTATREHGETMGEFVEFTFPKNPYDCDREEISDFIENHAGWVFQGGGSPGAPLDVKFDQAKDHDSLNLQSMVPFFPCDKYAELYGLLVKQWELQNGRPLEGYIPLSSAKGEYNSCPQEKDNKVAVDKMIVKLQDMTK